MSTYIIVAVAKNVNGSIAGVECSDGSHFKRSTVVSLLKQGHTFYTQSLENRAIVFSSTYGNITFIKTAADGLLADNLGSLPICQHQTNSVWI